MKRETYTKRQIIAALLLHFETNPAAWERAIAINYYLDISEGDAENAVACAKSMMAHLSTRDIPFEVDRFFGLDDSEPQVNLSLAMDSLQASVLAGIDEDAVHLYSGTGSAEDQKTASVAIDAHLKQSA